MNRVSWPQVCRAESSLAAYQTAADWFTRLSHDQAMAKVALKVEEKRRVIEDWRQQQEQKRAEKANEDYHKQVTEE